MTNWMLDLKTASEAASADIYEVALDDAKQLEPLEALLGQARRVKRAL